MLSLGSAGEHSWEEAVAAASGCHVHAFDCSVQHEADLGDSGRLHVHPVCLNASDGGVHSVAKALRAHGSGGTSVLRLNLEGLEHAVIDSLLHGFLTDPSFSAELPDQLLLGVRHTYLSWLPLGQQVPMGTLGGLFLGLARMGYSLIAREDSAACPHCSAFTYVRTAC